MRLINKNTEYNAGDGKPVEKEPFIKEIKFKTHKFTNKIRPKKENIVIFPMFSEFGCETLAVVYCLPLLLRQMRDKYVIIMGWQGREYFYRHLADEFWEIDESLMFLRDYCRAFHHVSRNLKRAERDSKKIGTLIDISHITNVAVFPMLEVCPTCNKKVSVVAFGQYCDECKVTFPHPGLFHDVEESKKKARWLPKPRDEYFDWAKSVLPKNPVGITARNRKTWGRNLDPVFYERLIFLLEDMGYNPVWLGEKVTSLPCPYKRIFDFSSLPEAMDLEKTLALVSLLKFTIQYYTASTRLAGLAGTPFVIIESPDQIWGKGQEGYRLSLLSRNSRKLVVCHYKLANENHGKLLDLSERAIEELLVGDTSDIIGLVEDKRYVEFWRMSQKDKINGRS